MTFWCFEMRSLCCVIVFLLLVRFPCSFSVRTLGQSCVYCFHRGLPFFQKLIFSSLWFRTHYDYLQLLTLLFDRTTLCYKSATNPVMFWMWPDFFISFPALCLTRALGSRVLVPLEASLWKKAGAHWATQFEQPSHVWSIVCGSIPAARARQAVAAEPDCRKKPCASKGAREEGGGWHSACPPRSLPEPRPRNPSNRKNWTDTITYTMMFFKDIEYLSL